MGPVRPGARNGGLRRDVRGAGLDRGGCRQRVEHELHRRPHLRAHAARIPGRRARARAARAGESHRLAPARDLHLLGRRPGHHLRGLRPQVPPRRRSRGKLGRGPHLVVLGAADRAHGHVPLPALPDRAPADAALAVGGAAERLHDRRLHDRAARASRAHGRRRLSAHAEPLRDRGRGRRRIRPAGGPGARARHDPALRREPHPALPPLARASSGCR